MEQDERRTETWCMMLKQMITYEDRRMGGVHIELFDDASNQTCLPTNAP